LINFYRIPSRYRHGNMGIVRLIFNVDGVRKERRDDDGGGV
jgi:hypothetical protein